MKPATIGSAPKYPIESVDNALNLISMFVSEETIRVKDAAELLGVATGTAHRLLAMLLYRGYVTQDPVSKLYRPGPLLLSVGLRASGRFDLQTQAYPYLEQLNAELNETVHLAVLNGSQVLYVDGIESRHTLRVASRAGTMQPAHCTSAGKALLAALPRPAVLQLYPDEELVQVTGHSINSQTQLLVELDNTKARGYATNFSELEDGIGSIGVAVLDHAGNAVASLAIGAPMSRLTGDRLDQFGAATMAAAERLHEQVAAAGTAKSTGAAPRKARTPRTGAGS